MEEEFCSANVCSDLEEHTLSLAEFVKLHKDNIDKAINDVKSVYKMNLSPRIMQIMNGIDENECERTVEKLLTFPDYHIESNDDTPNPEIDTINSLSNQFKEKQKLIAYLIIAPRTADESAMREEQFEVFKSIYPGLDPTKCTTVNVLYYEAGSKDNENLKSLIKEYLTSEGTNAIKVIVVFNGHGAPAGMVFGYRSVGTETVPVDVFINDTKNVIEGLPFPRLMDIVLAQCHSHHHSQPDVQEVGGTRLRVICLTSPTHEFTFNDVDPLMYKGLRYHRELTKYCVEIAKSKNVENVEKETPMEVESLDTVNP